MTTLDGLAGAIPSEQTWVQGTRLVSSRRRSTPSLNKYTSQILRCIINHLLKKDPAVFHFYAEDVSQLNGFMRALRALGISYSQLDDYEVTTSCPVPRATCVAHGVECV